MKKISLVIPSFNEENNIEAMVKRCEEVFAPVADFCLEYIFIDDGSRDKTFPKIKEVCENKASLLKGGHSITGISFSRNFGKESALLAGLEASTGDYVCVIDADLQQDPSYALEMATFLEQNPDYDCVACYQEKRKESFFMRFAKKCFYKIVDRISETSFEENASDFRLMRRAMVQSVMDIKEYNRFSKGIFSWVGYKTHYMPYDVRERTSGTTSWNVRKLTRYAIDGFIGYSTAPLRIATWVGGCVSLVALIYLIAVIVEKLAFGTTPPGYATIICIMLILGGLQLLFLGIIGEYIGHMYMEVKNRPSYIIKEKIHED